MNQYDHFELDLEDVKRDDTERELRAQDLAAQLAWSRHFAHPDPRDPDYSPAPGGGREA